jgi:predicted RNase H-like HicB family nuclease
MCATQIRLEREGDWWVATDLATGVASQGRSREAALEMLDDALAGHDGEGKAPTDAELRELGVDPGANVSGDEPAEFME